METTQHRLQDRAPTAIDGDTICEDARSAYCAINRERAEGIRKALKPDNRDGENSDDVSFREKCQLHLVLTRLGLELRDDGELAL